MGWRPEVPAVVVIALALLAACSGAKDEIEGSWEPVNVASLDLPEEFPSSEAVLTFEGGEYTGSDGCNEDVEYSGTYELDGDKFSTSPDQQNQVGTDCGTGLLDWFQVLGRTSSAAIDSEGRLVLEDSAGEVVATLKPVS